MKVISDLDQATLVKRSLSAVWHPCTQMKHHESLPLIAITKGKGAWLYDEQENALLDCISSWWTNLFGHSNQRINQAITNQLEKIEHVMLAGFTHQPVVELSEKLSALTQKYLGHVFYASDGASAVEIALKMSHHYWQLQGKPQKKKFVCLENGYHGETLGALAVTDVAIFRKAYGSLLQEVYTISSPDSRKAQTGESAKDVAIQAAHELEKLFQKEHEHIAAIIVEPLVQCAGQMAMYSPEYLRLVKTLCERYDIHLIADEIAVGCGRTGKFFACEHAGIWPDFLTLSKGISGGYLPLSLCMTTEKIYRAFYSDQTQQGFLHSHSYTGNPLACAAALACLEIFESEKVLERNVERSTDLADAFAWAKVDPRIEHWRQQAMILAFDIKSEVLKNQKAFPREMFSSCLNEGVLIRPIANTVYVMPPYILSTEEAMAMGSAVQRALNQVLA
ncbi:adenosylmethionine--8-amino-7-oxononanoate transaminase [Polynucleobacter asymbioticus]|uniref:Adenosylmethionine-8-amino-7-oxononanoate aminotransferase n=1 Tax=Polynucleobacter asymbioticus TaxID=576611 RepID=A0AAC9ITN4_9BURK|nr:adenosylmethionine--8-amino-7-oxononanoate transaminase [Polynucleobacter asymbioticus]APB98017.1 adenosylmethionine--8-amino-7-oxononanoate aminotransferase BioA [Polynucleobacter asymbioticus]APC00303.1 adenosylmethionine--8-amino-7-oxononanoate aminotransferase BioA [Polynucleobacter asymbioticus]